MFVDVDGVMEWLVAVNLVLVVLVVYRLIRRVSLQADHIAELEQAILSLQERHAEDHRVSIDAAYGVGRRLADTEKRLRETAEKQAQMENLQSVETASRSAQRIRQKAAPAASPTRTEARLAALLRPGPDDEN